MATIPAAAKSLLRLTPTIAPVPHRGMLYVSGPHASEFLNGLLSSSVAKSSPRPFFSSFLHAQGRVICDVFLYPKQNSKGQDGYVIEYDQRIDETQPLKATLQRFVLRSKVRIEDYSSNYDVWSIWGSENGRNEIENDTSKTWAWARSGVIEPVWSTQDPWPWTNTELSLNDCRAPGMGIRKLVAKDQRPEESSTHDLLDEKAYTLHRILRGVPEGADDIPMLQAFPMESNLDVMGGLDFRKGCYVGQELTVRTFHLGVLRKRILPVLIHPDPSGAKPRYQSDIRAVYSEQNEGRPRVRGTGKLLSTVDDVGLALMRLEQVEAVEKGVMKFEIERTEDGTTTKKWDLSHWWPDWWPKEPQPSESES